MTSLRRSSTCFGIGAGVVEARVADQDGEGGGLLQAQAGHVEAVELARGRLDPVGTGTEVNRVDVELEDPVLGVPSLQLGGDEGFLDLALDGDLVADEDVLHHLLGDGRTTAGAAGPEVVEGGRGDGGEGDPVMVVEALVLGCQDGVLQQIGNLFDPNRLGVAAVVELGQELAPPLE